MAQFVEIDGGLVNLDFVAEIRRVKPHHTYFYGADGRKLGQSASCWNTDWKALTSQVVPAVAGEYAYVIYVLDDGESRPKESDVEVYKYPICGWRISADDAEPILAEEVNKTAILLPMGDGKVVQPYDRTYNNLEEAKAAFLADATKDWEREKQEAKAA
jgi:hypothetical protein